MSLLPKVFKPTVLDSRRRNLDDGTHIVHPKRFALMNPSDTATSRKRFIPAHEKFRVIAIAAPVPPYVGYPIDPPFRSRFQARFMDPVGAMMSLQTETSSQPTAPTLYDSLRTIILATQYASESNQAIDIAAKTALQAFPQTALTKLHALVSKFPPPKQLTGPQLARLMLTIHPRLVHSEFVAWAMLSRQTEEAGLGALGSPALTGDNDHLGYLGYQITRIERASPSTVRLHFSLPGQGAPVVVEAAAGPRDLLSFPWKDPKSLEFFPTDRFMGILTCMLQAHALGWDISYVPPASPSTASCSTSTLVTTFGALLGYEVDTLHMYKELGGRELIMRRKVDSDGSTTWEPR